MPVRWQTWFALGLLSASLIAFQLALMQILSYLQWYHFAGMAIAVALLGFGSAATVLSLARDWLLARSEALLPVLMLACAVAMGGSLALTQALFGGFDSYLLFVDWRQALYLMLTQLVLLLPFLFGALAIGMVFVGQVRRIGTLYCANMAGSGLGGLLALPILWTFLPHQLAAVCAFPAALAALVIAGPQRRMRLLSVFVLGWLALLLVAAKPLVPSQYKSLTQALELPGAKVELRQPSPYGLVELVSAPALRSSPTISLSYSGEIPVLDAVFNNGDWLGPLLSDVDARYHALQRHSLQALPYALGRRERVLALQSGTGAEVVLALAEGARRVVAVEPHRALIGLLQEGRARSRWARDPRVTIETAEPRTFLDIDHGEYDLIAVPEIGSFGGNAGLHALSQQRLLTIEAMRASWERLAADGVLQLNCWIDYPLRSPVRLAATVGQLLREEGVENPDAHLLVLRSWGTLAFLVKKTPLSYQEQQAARAFARKLQFDLIRSGPGGVPGFSGHHATEQELLDRLDQALRADVTALGDYPYRWMPSTDDRPFFSQFLSWRSLPRVSAMLGERSMPFIELGYLIQYLSLIQIGIAAVLLIMLPLIRLGWTGGGKRQVLLYFGGLGIGYMFFEMALLHLLESYLGQPVFAAAGAIGLMLVFSGAGSLVSQRIRDPAKSARQVVTALALLIAAYALLMPGLLGLTAELPLAQRGLFAALLLAPVAFAMGFPFPLGLRGLEQTRPTHIAWAWGINGCLSVLATPLATILAVEAGFRTVFLLGAAAYAAAAFPRRA